MSPNSPLEAGAVLAVLLVEAHKILPAVCLVVAVLRLAVPQRGKMQTAVAEQCESSGAQEELSLQLTLGTFK